MIETYNLIKPDLDRGLRVGVVTDSEYVIKSIRGYIHRSHLTIPNKELVQRVHQLYYQNPLVSLLHVRSHTGLSDRHSIGNMWADKLANESIVSTHS